jgi:hypothetical protein
LSFTALVRSIAPIAGTSLLAATLPSDGENACGVLCDYHAVFFLTAALCFVGAIVAFGIPVSTNTRR